MAMTAEEINELMGAVSVLASLVPWHECDTCSYCRAMAVLHKHARGWPLKHAPDERPAWHALPAEAQQGARGAIHMEIRVHLRAAELPSRHADVPDKMRATAAALEAALDVLGDA